MKYWFEWNGVKCTTKGIRLQSMPPVIRPEERVDHVVIPGRSGELTQTEGADVYNSYIQTIPLIIDSEANVRAAEAWLRGDGYVTFSGQGDLKQRARVINSVTFAKHSRNSTYWEGEVQFYCQPLKELLHDTPVTVTTSGTSVRNRGDVDARPMWKVTVAGSGSGKSVTLGTITVTGLTGGSVIWIDSDMMEIWNAAKTATITQQSSGAFPVLVPGDNSVTFTGASSIEIEKRERFL